ncbi:alpha/beta-hydrolase [Jaminaea rosea]|uniref:Alpha/beta-hydrolase n=1 Tax=Jaminaea rosea TaxID=1569628 RepID=A0A316UV13_9BASI|nr:alpha/beta-hydrolase [Jaminaea rosea]PWN28171.1 alpha/beta-hydrolase [Jaminaea rosea]
MLLDKTFDCSGWEIHYKIIESSPALAHSAQQTLVVVHGTPWSSIVFDAISAALLASTPNLHILLYDLPGYGQSQYYSGAQQFRDFDGDTSVAFQATALVALLEETRISNPLVVAHDIAGAIVLRAHTLHSLELKSLLLMDTNTVLPWGDGFYKLVRANPSVFLDMPPQIHEGVVRSVIRSACHHTVPQQMEDALAAPWLGAEGQRNFVRQIAQANDADVQEMLDCRAYEGKVTCAVKVLWGEVDGWIPRGKMETLVEMLGTARCGEGLVIVPEAGHLLMIDQPERVALEVGEWVRSA